MGGFLQMTLMTMMNSIIEINSSSDSDEEKGQAGGGFVYHKGTDCKLRGAVPAPVGANKGRVQTFLFVIGITGRIDFDDGIHHRHQRHL